MRPPDDVHEGQLRRWFGDHDPAAGQFIVLRIYADDHVGLDFVDFLQGDQIYRSFSLDGMLQLSEPVS